jgi:cell division protein ZapA
MTTTVSIKIAGRAYEIACDEGQARTLENLAVEVDQRAQQLLKAVGPVSDTRLLVMVALTLVDDLTEARKKAGPTKQNAAPVASEAVPVIDEMADQALAASLDLLASRISSIAERIGSA